MSRRTILFVATMLVSAACAGSAGQPGQRIPPTPSASPTPTKTPEPATANCAFVDHPAAQTRGGGRPHPTDPVIKATLSGDGQKVYYVPGMRRYPNVKVDESRGETWFCRESEAERAGWRAATSPRD